MGTHQREHGITCASPDVVAKLKVKNVADEPRAPKALTDSWARRSTSAIISRSEGISESPNSVSLDVSVHDAIIGSGGSGRRPPDARLPHACQDKASENPAVSASYRFRQYVVGNQTGAIRVLKQIAFFVSVRTCCGVQEPFRSVCHFLGFCGWSPELQR